MHYLQKMILDKLRYEPSLHYSDLMPDGIESSHFRYNLKQLMNEGLIAKNDDRTYHLSDKGLQEVDYLSDHRTTIIRTPKVITYTLLTRGSKILLYKKPKEPYRDLWGLIGGKLHFGENTQYAAQREVYEKIGLQIILPNFCGITNLTVYQHGRPLTHAIAFIHKLDIPDLPPEPNHQLMLVSKAALDDYALAPDLKPILQTIYGHNHPFATQIRVELST